jgi:thymidine phosphorylase
MVDSGAALETFRNNIVAQGGDARVCDDPEAFLPLVSESVKVESPRSGVITRIETTEIGHAIAAIGGGRVRIEDVVDPTVGFVTNIKVGDHIAEGEEIGVVYCANSDRGEEAARRIQAAYTVSDDSPAKPLILVKEIINE